MPTFETSFVIPAFNEAEHIGGVIKAIRQFADEFNNHEVIVVDNGSTDDTLTIAKQLADQAFSRPDLTVGGLRNFGAAQARYANLVFLDADVYVTPQWARHVGDALARINAEEFMITGSVCGVGKNPGWIERCWWPEEKLNRPVNYINSGHLIVTRKTFKALGGFDPTLETGEDAEFCHRHRDVTVKVAADPRLKVMHEGYPKTVGHFFRRERWHGIGDYTAWHHFVRSKPALVAMTQMFLLLFGLMFAVVTGNLYYLYPYLIVVVGTCGLAAYQRHPRLGRCFLNNCFLFWVYFFARGLSLWAAIRSRR